MRFAHSAHVRRSSQTLARMTDASSFTVVKTLDAAQRQAAQAIRLFFQRGDDVAIHTLVAAAHQIASDLCAHAGIKRELEDSEILKEMGAHKEVLAALRQPQNFFKHADRDPDGTVRFNPFLSVGLLVYFIYYYTQLTQRRFVEGDVFLIWFYLKHPERAPTEYQAAVRHAASIIDHNDFSFFSTQIEQRSKRG